MKQIKLLFLLFVALCTGSSSSASSQQTKGPAVGSRASGKITYKGITTKINHVYAQDTRDLLDEGMGVEEVDVLLSERSLSAIEPDKQIPYRKLLDSGSHENVSRG